MGNQFMLSARDLEAIDKKVYEPKKEQLLARTLFSLKTDVHEGAESYLYDVMTESGSAKIIANGADDIPLVDGDIESYSQPIFSIASAFAVTLQEQRAAAMTGQTIDTAKAGIVQRAIAEKENRLVFHGDKKHGLKGIINADGIQKTNFSKKASELTGKEFLEELRKAKALITNISGFADARLMLLVPPTISDLLDKDFDDLTGKTVKEKLNDRNWFDKIKTVTDLERDENGKKTDPCILIVEDSAETVEILLPKDISRLQEEVSSFKIKVPYEERCGGVIIRQPYGIVKIENV